MDVLSELITTPYAFHGIIVGTVLLFALLVFVFGFKPAEEPPFDKLTDDRRAAGKKKKVKDKKAQSNGHATAVSEGAGKKEVKTPKKEDKKEVDKSPTKEKQKQEKKSPAKNTLKETKANKEVTKKDDSAKNNKKGKGKENVEVTAKNKKNKHVDEKPKDFDDGEWEQALSRKDKKNRKPALEEILPQKNEKKKDKKKAKDEDEDEKTSTPEPVAKVSEPYKIAPFDIMDSIQAAAEVEIEPVKPAPAPEKIQTVIYDTAEPVVDEKPKKQRAKKKQAPQPPEPAAQKTDKPAAAPAAPKAEKAPKAPQPAAPGPEPVELSPPKPPKQEKKKPKEPSPEPAPVATPELIAVPVAEPSNVAFDELGDTWKEAKAPKKSNKKKTRKD